jgi:hypothetical protein
LDFRLRLFLDSLPITHFGLFIALISRALALI